jgi:calcineurin-like phosphoesterase family protein
MSNIFFTSDLHLGHRNLLKFTKPRPFATIDEHDEAVLENWNSVVKTNDIIYVLGDIALNKSPEELELYLKKLNGHKRLILGNHDRAKVHASYLNSGIWESMREYEVVKLMDNRGISYECVLFHYPILEPNHVFNKFKAGKIGPTCHFYGHIHCMNDYDEIYQRLGFRAAHVGLDTSDKYPNTKAFTPINFEDLLTWFDENF